MIIICYYNAMGIGDSTTMRWYCMYADVVFNCALCGIVAVPDLSRLSVVDTDSQQPSKAGQLTARGTVHPASQINSCRHQCKNTIERSSF